MTRSEIIQLFEKSFKNIIKRQSNDYVYDYHYKVVNSMGSETAEIFYSTGFKEWAVIIDNFPGPRKHYKWILPIKDLDTLVNLISLTGIVLDPLK